MRQLCFILGKYRATDGYFTRGSHLSFLPIEPKESRLNDGKRHSWKVYDFCGNYYVFLIILPISAI